LSLSRPPDGRSQTDSRPSPESHSSGERNCPGSRVGCRSEFSSLRPRASYKTLCTGAKRSDDRARRAHRPVNLAVEYLELPGERIPLQDASVDSVVSTFTLGTIPDVISALQGMRRVLRPEGKLIFLELGLSPEEAVRRWQKRWDPTARWLFEGLHLTLD